MSRTCSCCGKVVEGMPRFFMSRLPNAYATKKDDLVFDSKFMCHANGTYFISCEIELPFQGSEEGPLGFIVWAQVSEATYNAYRTYRANEDTLPPYQELVSGQLANPVPEIPDALGVEVKFKVLPRDPTPYIRWAEPSSAVAERMEKGATHEFWHKVVSRLS